MGRFVTVNAVQQTVLAPPRLSVTLGRRLYAETTGFISELQTDERRSSLTSSLQIWVLQPRSVGQLIASAISGVGPISSLSRSHYCEA